MAVSEEVEQKEKVLLEKVELKVICDKDVIGLG